MPVGTSGFPTSLDTAVELVEASNNAATTLSAQLTAGATTASVVSTALFASSGVIVIENEIITYTGKTGTTFTGLVRGFLGTTDATHAIAQDVEGIITAVDHNVLAAAIIAIETKLGTGAAIAVAKLAALTAARVLVSDGSGFLSASAITAAELAAFPADIAAKLTAALVSGFGLTLIDDADAAAARTTLGLGTLATQSGTFSGTSSGTNTGDQTIALTGDVIGSGTGSFAATIADDAVTYAKLQNITTARLLGRATAGSGNAEEIALGTGLSFAGTTLNAATSFDLGWYIATDHGLTGDGVTDDTAALQALIDTVTAAGGGTIYFPAGTYLIAGPFVAPTSSQIALPTVLEADPFVGIHLIGALPVSTSFWTVSTNSPTGAPYSVIKSTATGGTGVNAIFRGKMDVGATFYNNLVMRYTNLIIACPANPTFTAIDMTEDLGGWVDDCLIYAGTIDLDALTEPTNSNSYAIKLPGLNHSSGTKVTGLGVTGFYYGIQDGEAAQLDNVAIQGCRVALAEVYTGYPGMHGFISIAYCPYAIAMLSAQARYLSIRQLDIEAAHAPQAAWQTTVNHCDDASNFLFGSVQWFGGTGVPSIIKNGGTNLIFTHVGTPPVALDPPTFASGEVGTVSDSTVVITFSEAIKASSYTAGVTIDVNATPATISSGTRQAVKSIVRYVLSVPVISTDAVTFSYAAIDGFLQSEVGTQMADIVDEVVTNNVAGGPFSPDDIAGMMLWLAADELVLSDNDPVSAWLDLSAAANHAVQATGGLQPLYKTAQLNALPIVRFDGTDDNLALTAPLNSQDFTYFAVVKHTAANNGAILGHNDAGTTWDFAGGGDQKPRLIKTNTALIGQATTTIGAGFAIIAVTYATPNVAFYLNGAADGTASSAQTFTLTSALIGAQFGVGTPQEVFGGDIAELICYDSVLSTTDRDDVFTFLNAKYAVY